MSPRTRWLVFAVSTPLVLLTAVGGLLGTSGRAAQQGFAHLRVFQDVVSLIANAYVEPVDIDRVMEGAMRGLADGLDASSAYLTAEDVRALDANTPPPAGDVGVVVTRQFYLLVVGVRDGSPAARAGLRTGDYIRGIDGRPTRDMSAFAGARALRGAPGTKVSLIVIRGNAADPHVVDLVRTVPSGPAVTGRRLPGGAGLVRVASFTPGAAVALRREVEALARAGARGVIIDLRGTADGPVAEGIAAARHFVKAGILATEAGRGPEREVARATDGDVLATPVVLLVSNGTAQAAEVFAAALGDNGRAELVGEPTAGIAAVQRLVRLPEGRGLWLTYARYQRADGTPIHERGLRPDVPVEEPSVAFGDPPPADDPALAEAVARLRARLEG